LGSTSNIFQRIFRGLNITSTVYLDRVQVWIRPFDKSKDKLKLLSNDKDRKIIANPMTDGGVMTIEHVAGADLTASDWNSILNRPAYRLNIEVCI
jgi:hypothetical protein